MGIDFKALRDRLRRMENAASGGTSLPQAKSNRWSPPEGESVVRIVPQSLTDEYDPFKEIYLYFNLGTNKQSYLSLWANFKKADPIQEFRQKLYAEGTKESKTVASKLRAKPRYYAPVVVRGEEDLGVRWWGFSESIYKYLLDKFLDTKWGDMSHPNDGRDITVKRVNAKKPGAYDEIAADLNPNKTPLANDDTAIANLVQNIPPFDELFTVPTYEELSSLLDVFMAKNMSSDPNAVGNSPDVEYGTDGAAVKSEPEEAVAAEETSGAFAQIDRAFDSLVKKKAS